MASSCSQMAGFNQQRYNPTSKAKQSGNGHQFQWNRLAVPGSPRVAFHQKAAKTWTRHVAEDPEQRKLLVVADLQQPGHRKVVVRPQLGICVSQEPQREILMAPAHFTVGSSRRTLRLQIARNSKKYCYAFTRFGRCNKGDQGRCHYIHDASKIAVCTRFVTDICGDIDCKLTHRLIPERMPDCVHFLRGFCINERCPYRHVKTDAKAAICEQFLQGSCPDASICDSKHTYDSPRSQNHLKMKQEPSVSHTHQPAAGTKRKRDVCCEGNGDIPIPSDTPEDEVSYERGQRISALYAAGLGQLYEVMAAGGEIGSFIKPAFAIERPLYR